MMNDVSELKETLPNVNEKFIEDYVFKFYNVAPFYRTFYTVRGKHLDMNVQENPQNHRQN